jgi:hypothetical protein
MREYADVLETRKKDNEEQTPTVGKDEMNLAEFPIARIGRKDKREAIEYVGWAVGKDGLRKQQKWTIRSAAGLGLPTEFAERVLVSLMAITAGEKFVSRKVTFSVYRILKMLGLTINKRNYKAVEKALKQLVGITIYSEGAFFDKEKQKRVTTLRGFHLIDDIWLRYLEDDESVKVAEGSNGYIVWGDRLWNSFKVGYIKNLDVDFYYSLDNAVARRLYRFLDKRMYYQDEYQIDIFDLAARIGLSRYRYPSEVKKKLTPGFDELIERGFLKSIETIKVGKYTRVRFVKRPKYTQRSLWDGPEVSTSGSETLPQALSEREIAIEQLQEQYDTSVEDLDFWQRVLDELKPSAPNVFKLVRDAEILKYEDDAVLICVAGKYQLGMLSHPGSLKVFNRALKYVAGKPIELEIVIPEIEGNTI